MLRVYSPPCTITRPGFWVAIPSKPLRCHSSPKQATLETPEYKTHDAVAKSLGHRPAPSDPLIYETLAVTIIGTAALSSITRWRRGPLTVLQFLLCLQAS